MFWKSFLMSVFILLVIVLMSGCKGDFYPWGTLKVKVNVPGLGQGEEVSFDEGICAVKILKVTVNKRVGEDDLGKDKFEPVDVEKKCVLSGGTYDFVLENIPVGFNEAIIEVFAKDDETRIAWRKYEFYMPSGGFVESEKICAGVRLERDGSVCPSVLYIPAGTSIFWGNFDFYNDRIIRLVQEETGEVIEAGPVTGGAYLGECFFYEPGVYSYDEASGMMGKIVVFDFPEVKSVKAEAGNSFLIEGMNFGEVQSEVSGKVNFYKEAKWGAMGIRGFSKQESRYTSIFVYGGVPYVAYKDITPSRYNDNKAVVMKYTGKGETGWEQMGEKISVESVDYVSLVVQEGEIPVVAYSDIDTPTPAPSLPGLNADIGAPARGRKITVMKYVRETGWEPVGQELFSDGMASFVSLFEYDGNLYVGSSDTDKYGHYIGVRKYTGKGETGWSLVGGRKYIPDVPEFRVLNASFCMYDGTIYAAYVVGKKENNGEENDGEIFVIKYREGSSGDWETVGNEDVEGFIGRRCFISADGEFLYLAFRDKKDNCYKTTLLKSKLNFNDESSRVWEPVRSSSVFDSRIDAFSFAFENNIPFLSYKNMGDSKEIEVKYTSENVDRWVSVGEEGFAPGIIYPPSLFFSDTGLYIVYSDGEYDEKISVMKFSYGSRYDCSVLEWSDNKIQVKSNLQSGEYLIEVKVRGESSFYRYKKD